MVLLALAIAVTTTVIAAHFDAWKGFGGVISTSRLDVVPVRDRRNEPRDLGRRLENLPPRASAAARSPSEDFDLLLNSRGLLARLFRPLFRLITQSWHMLPLGFLFGLGFDTATEVALLGISATQAAKACRSGRSWCSRPCSRPACR